MTDPLLQRIHYVMLERWYIFEEENRDITNNCISCCTTLPEDIAYLCGLKDGKRSFSHLDEKIQMTHFNMPLFFSGYFRLLSSTPLEPQEFCENIFPKSQLHTANGKWGKRMNLFLHIGVVKPMLTFFQQFLLPLFPVHFTDVSRICTLVWHQKETCLGKKQQGKLTACSYKL